VKHLPFNANGHQSQFADGQLVYVSYSLGDPFVPDLMSARCGTCDARLDSEVTDAVTVRTPCPYPDGVTSVITLAVPSGKVIVSDDLRPVYDWDDSEMASYNSALGQKQAVEAMAAAGCAYGPVGNSCPGLYRTGPDTYVIASLGYDEESEEILPAGWEYLTAIITDLWAYSIADYEDWKAKGGDPGSLNWADSVIGIAPGTYQFTHHTGERNLDRDAEGTVIFADIRYSREGAS
jgi:hypothetical protein